MSNIIQAMYKSGGLKCDKCHDNGFMKKRLENGVYIDVDCSFCTDTYMTKPTQNQQDAIKKIKEEIIDYESQLELFLPKTSYPYTQTLGIIEGLQTALSILKGENND